MAADFKLQVGLDCEGSLTQIKNDINRIEKDLNGIQPPIHLKVGFITDKPVLQRAINVLSKQLPKVPVEVELDVGGLKEQIATVTKLLRNVDLSSVKSKHTYKLDADMSDVKKIATAKSEIELLLMQFGKITNVSDEARKAFADVADASTKAAKAGNFTEAANGIQILKDELKELSANTKSTLNVSNIAKSYERLNNAIASNASVSDNVRDKIQSIAAQLAKIDKHGSMDILSDDEVASLIQAKTLVQELTEAAGLKTIRQIDVPDFKKIESQIQTITASLHKLGASDSGLNDSIEKLKGNLISLQDAMDGGLLNPDEVALANNLRSQIEQIVNDWKTLKLQSGNEFFDEAQLSKLEKARNAVRELVSEYPKILTDDHYAEWFKTIDKMDFTNIDKSKVNVTKLVREMERFNSEVTQANLATKRWSDQFVDIFKSVTLSNIATEIISAFRQAFTDMARNIQVLDTAMVELRKVTDEAESSYDKFFQSAKKQAQEVGTSLSAVINATADFARMGYSLADSTQMAEIAQIYYNIGDGFDDISESTESLISVMAGFNLTAQEAYDIIDSINSVSNQHAISASGLGQSLQNSAAALYEAGASMQEAIALTTATNLTLQDPSQTGNALRTVALRIRSTAVELEKMGEDASGAAESTSKLRDKVKALTSVNGGKGVDLLNEDETAYRNIYDILRDIAAVWQDIDKMDRSALLELLAGKNRSNALAGLLNNFNEAEDALAHAMDSSGSALEENQKYLDSISGKLANLKAAWESLSASVINSEVAKFAIDLATNIVKALDKIVNSLGSVNLAFGTILAGKGIKMDIGQMFKDIKAGASVSTSATIALKNGLLSLANASAIVMAIGLAKWFYDTFISIDQNIDKISALREEISTLKDSESDIQSLGKRFEELSQKQSLSSEEQKEYNELQNRLHDLMPELEGYYNAQNNFIITEIDGVDDLTKKYQDLIGAKREAIATQYFDENFFGLSPYKADEEKMNRAQAILNQDSLDQYKILYDKYGDLSQLSWWDKMTQFAWTNGETYDYWNLWNTTYKQQAPSKIESEQNKTYNDSLTARREAFTSLLLSDNKARYKTPEEQNAIIEALQGADRASLNNWSDRLNRFGTSAFDSVFSAIKTELPAYNDIVSGKLDALSPTARNAVVDLGGLSKANELLEIYEENQKQINDGTFDWNGKLKETHIAAIEAYRAWLEAQNEAVNAPKNITEISAGEIDITSYKELDDAVESLGKAYTEFAENASVGLDTLDSLQDTFGTCGEAWDDFVNTVADGDSTLSDVKTSAEKLAESYLDEKVSLGEVNKQTKAHIQSMLESIGVTNADIAVNQALEESQKRVVQQVIAEQAAKADATTTSEEFRSAVLAECELLGIESAIAQTLFDEINNTAAAKIASSMNGDFLTATQEEIDKLIEEAIAAGMVKDELLKLYQAEQDRRTVLAAEEAGISTAESRAAEERLAALQSEVNEFRNQSVSLDVNLNLSDAYKSSLKDAESEFDKFYDQLQAMRDANLISEEKYLQKLCELNERYNKNNAATYRKYAMEIFSGMKSMMSDKVTASYDAEIASLEAQKRSTERYYDSLIDAEQDKLDLLREQWETEEHLLKIEKARAELARVQQQKNVRVYREGQGFVWEADQGKIQDATATVNNALKEYERYQKELAIEKRIEQLEELKETVINSIEEQIEAARRAKEEALKNLEELQFSAEAFLKFLEMFGIEVDDKTLEMIKSFDLMAEQAGLSFDDLEKSLTEAGEKWNQFKNGNITGGSTTTNVTADGKENPETGDPNASNASGEYGDFGIFSDFMETMKLFQNDLTLKLEEIQSLWTNHLEFIMEKLRHFQANGIDRTKDKTLLMVEEITKGLEELVVTFKTFSEQSMTSLEPMLDNFNKLFVGEIENPFESSDKEVLNWFEYFLIGIDEIIKKFTVWWEEHLKPYMDYVEEKHQWLLEAIKEEIDAVEEWHETMVKALEEVRDLLGEVVEYVEEACDALETLAESIEGVGSAASGAVGAVQSLASAINSLQSKTVTIDVVTRYSSVGSPAEISTQNSSGAQPNTTPYVPTKPATATPEIKYFADGVVGASSSSWAITDEEGPELIIPGKGTFRRLKMGTSVLPADISRNLWAIGQNPLGFAAGIANMISNRKEDNKTYQVNVGDIILHEVQNARQVANELKGLVLKAEQLVFSK